MIRRSGAIFLLIFVLFIAFIYWYLIIKNPCEPMTKCSINSVNKSCASDKDCYLGSIRGNCNINTFKCVNLILEGDEEDCKNARGEWIEWGCLN